MILSFQVYVFGIYLFWYPEDRAIRMFASCVVEFSFGFGILSHEDTCAGTNLL